jgi:hypothetical protein
MSRFKALAILAVAATLPVASSSLFAQNANEFSTGTTSLTLDSNLVTALTADNVTVTATFPATLSGSTAAFPIATGAVDLDTLVGVVYHSGGLTFTGGNTVVTVSQLAISDQGAGTQPLVYGLVTVNGTVAGLFPLFDVSGPVTLPITGNTVNIPNLTLTLSGQAATLLNDAFDFNGFTNGQTIGVADVSGTVAPFTSSNPSKKPLFKR